ncbi:hypothetical protein [Amycolatopsis sp. cmx-4-54]|uniref:hypothetical protein n=1 Tax=Amycolatopsis sp. cmx-4-54 TaxID=2790936 RepID=UPI00397D28EB
MIRTTARRARKHHTHPYCCVIKPGEVYLEHVAAPDDNDLGNTHWWRLPECAADARRYGRGDLIDAREATP